MAFLAAALPAVAGAGGAAAGAAGGGLSTFLGLAGGLLSGFSAYQAGAYQAEVAKNNAKIAEQNAQRVSDQAQQQQQQSDDELRSFMGAQEAVQSASGLSTTGRSAIMTRKAAARVGRMDAENIIAEGAARTRDFQQQAANFRSEAKMAKATGMMGALQGGISGLTSLVGNSKPLSKSYYKRYGWST